MWCNQILKSKTRATKGFVLIRHKRYLFYISLQLSSAIASFVWKPVHFEFQGDKAKIAFLKKYTLISWFFAILRVQVLGKVCKCIFALFRFGVNKIVKVSSRCLHYLPAAILEDPGGSPTWWLYKWLHTKPYTEIMCGTFQGISQLWDNAHTLNLESCLLSLSSIISQFLDFIHCMVFDFSFHCVTTHTLYTLNSSTVLQLNLGQKLRWLFKTLT